MFGKLTFAVVAGAVVAVALYFLIALNTWTVIHSGWSDTAIRTFFNVMWVAADRRRRGGGADVPRASTSVLTRVHTTKKHND